VCKINAHRYPAGTACTHNLMCTSVVWSAPVCNRSNPNLINALFLGDEVLFKLRRAWWSELQGRYGNLFYIREEGGWLNRRQPVRVSSPYSLKHPVTTFVTGLCSRLGCTMPLH
jgi:hypothetical protein